MKYDTLSAFFQRQTARRLEMSFDDVAKAAKTSLPASAFQYPAWWSNDRTQHVQAKAWLDAGYASEQVDIEGRRVAFRRVAGGVSEHRLEFDAGAGERHPLLGAFKGLFSVSRDHDIAKPSLGANELREWEQSVARKADDRA